MNHPVQITVIGGTGKAGRYLVRELLHRGYSLRLLLRDPSRYSAPDPRVEIIPGDARDYAAVRTATEGVEAIISTLGQPAGEPTIFSQATSNILRAMAEHRIRRYIVITGLSVDTPTDRKSTFTQAATDWMKSHFPETSLDKQREYQLLTESPVAWTVVRIPWIQQTDEPVETRVSLNDCPGKQISATSLARFLSDQPGHTGYVRQAPFIANV